MMWEPERAEQINVGSYLGAGNGTHKSILLWGKRGGGRAQINDGGREERDVHINVVGGGERGTQILICCGEQIGPGKSFLLRGERILYTKKLCVSAGVKNGARK